MVGGMRGEDAQDISHQIEFDDQVETCRGGRGGGEGLGPWVTQRRCIGCQ